MQLRNVMCQPVWEADLGENGCMYMYGTTTMLLINRIPNTK